MRVAVVGGGVSGLSTAWLLNKNGHSVTLYEKEAKAGGHTDTDFSGPVPVDLGFQVYNLTTYPHLVGFFESLEVDTEPSEMSFGLSVDRGNLEWASHNLSSIFAQKRNLLEPKFWLMIYQVIRFGQKAPEVLQAKNTKQFSHMTLGEYIKLEGYSEYFKKFYLLPMCAAVWSAPFGTILEFPVVALVRFWVNHHLLDLFQRPVWRVVKERSVSYVNKVLAVLEDVRLGCPVESVTSNEGKVQIQTKSGETETFDAVVMATHSDSTLDILGSTAPEEEKSILGAIRYQENAVYYHKDTSLMPKLRSTWASWNFIADSDDEGEPVCVTYWLNRLQNLDASIPPLFVTLNPPSGTPKPDSVISIKTFLHPTFNLGGIEAQNRLGSIQGRRGIYFVGAWTGYGFHEDGMRSAVAVAEALGCRIPWTPRTTNPKTSRLDDFWLRVFDAFARQAIKRGALRCILPNGTELHYGDGKTDPSVSAVWRNAPSLSATLRIFNLDIFRKIVFKTDTGLGEAFMDSDFTVDHLGGLMAIMTVNAASLDHNTKSLGAWAFFGRCFLRLAHSKRANTIKGSQRNIKRHYDIGNAYYKSFLDETMTYSCGIHSEGRSLKEAQLKKLDAAIDALEIEESDRVLEIGCGWGSFAIRAVERTGCRVTGLTLSTEQLTEATDRVKAAGMTDLIDLHFRDYRHCDEYGAFDKVVSIEMIEAVGSEYLATYFDTIGRLVKPGGRVFIQAITVPDERYEDYCACSDFIRECVFPGGHLPCMRVIESNLKRNGMRVEKAVDIGLDYGVTLRQWRRRWVDNKDALIAAGCDPRLHLMYEIYFAYCEAGFDAEYIHDYQITAQKTTIPETTAVETAQIADLSSQVLWALYFFLAGVLVARRPYLWLAPVTSALLIEFLALSMKLSAMFEFHRRLEPPERLRWGIAIVRCTFAFSIALLSTFHLVFYGFHTTVNDIDSSNLLLYCSPVCVTLGFYGFQIWVMVYYHLYSARSLELCRCTLMLVLLGIATYKIEQVGFISALLFSEWHIFFKQLWQLAQTIGFLAAKSVIEVLFHPGYWRLLCFLVL